MNKLSKGGIDMNESNNQCISTLSYIAVERVIGWYDQTTNQTVHHIHLFTDEISTVKNRFKLEHVHDMSYRPFSNGDGLFYLHTNQGVFTYTIDADPTDFIRAYKKLRG